LNEAVSELPSGWVTITGASWWHRFRAGAGTPAANRLFGWMIALQIGVHFGLRFASDAYGWIGAAAFLVVLLLLAVAVILVAPGSSRPSLNFDTGHLRIGRHTTAFDEITQAAYFSVPTRRHRDSYISVGRGDLASTATICVRSTRGLAIAESDRELVAEMLRRSAVEIPQPRPDPFDPKGKFAWMDHPNHLTRDEAIEYVLHTPASGEPTRTPPPPRSIWIDED
jgi:hypothetical protein